MALTKKMLKENCISLNVPLNQAICKCLPGLFGTLTHSTRIIRTSATLLDVILTNKPGDFSSSALFNSEISGHHLIYSVMKDKVFPYQRKTNI